MKKDKQGSDKIPRIRHTDTAIIDSINITILLIVSDCTLLRRITYVPMDETHQAVPGSVGESLSSDHVIPGHELVAGREGGRRGRKGKERGRQEGKEGERETRREGKKERRRGKEGKREARRERKRGKMKRREGGM